jgi:hypothetical protein
MTATDRAAKRGAGRIAAMSSLTGFPQEAVALVKARGGVYWMAIPMALGLAQWRYAGFLGWLVIFLAGSWIFDLISTRTTQPLGIGASGGLLSIGNDIVSVGKASFWTGSKAVRLLGQWPVRDVSLAAKPGRGRLAPATLHLPGGIEVRVVVERSSLPLLAALTRPSGTAPSPGETSLPAS